MFARSKLDERINDASANRLVTQRLCLLLASMAAADGANAGAQLLEYAIQLTTAASDGSQVSMLWRGAFGTYIHRMELHAMLCL